MNLNRIIKKVIKESVRKKLNESKSLSDDDFYVLKTKTGGTLLVPKSSNPKITGTVNKPEFKKLMSSTAGINDFAKNNSYKITENCKKFYKDLALDTCYAEYVNWYYGTLSDGGVTRFEATLPSDGKRYVFRACTNSGDNINFKDRTLSGYYPGVIPDTMTCTGNPWSLNQNKSDEKDKFEFSMKFNIKLQMIK
jgi:hypothetical protein